MPLRGCQAVSSGLLRAFQLAQEELFAPPLWQGDWRWKVSDRCSINAECCCDPGRKISGFIVHGGNARNGIPSSYKWAKTAAPSIRVFNQVTLSVTGLNMRDASHNTHGHLFLDLVPVLPAETSL